MISCSSVPEAAISILQKEKYISARIHAAPGFHTSIGSFLYLIKYVPTKIPPKIAKQVIKIGINNIGSPSEAVLI